MNRVLASSWSALREYVLDVPEPVDPGGVPLVRFELALLRAPPSDLDPETAAELLSLAPATSLEALTQRQAEDGHVAMAEQLGSRRRAQARRRQLHELESAPPATDAVQVTALGADGNLHVFVWNAWMRAWRLTESRRRAA